MTEYVSDYPRPPILESSTENIVVKVLGEVLVKASHSFRVLETFHPPTYYFSPDTINSKFLIENLNSSSYCEWKGIASYFDVIVSGKCVPRCVWSYLMPSSRFIQIANYFALYPRLMDGCWINGEKVIPQPGGFYGGWITSRVKGPFKGDPNHPNLI